MECSLGLESSKFKLLNQYHYYIVFEKPPSEKIIKYVCISPKLHLFETTLQVGLKH